MNGEGFVDSFLARYWSFSLVICQNSRDSPWPCHVPDGPRGDAPGRALRVAIQPESLVPAVPSLAKLLGREPRSEWRFCLRERHKAAI